MLDPYKMVYVNLTASFILCAGLLIYKYVYPKRDINLFVVLILVSILPLLSLLRPGTYESGDFNIHIYRIMSFYDSLKEGHIMPSWAAELNATYGNPLFIFNYSLSYYLISFFHFIGFSFIFSTKLYLGINLFLSGIFMYLWIRTVTGNKFAAFVSAIFYVFNPYHLIDIHFRATLGESTIFTLAPLIFFFITKYFKKRKLIYLTLASIFTALLFLAHPLLALVFIGIMFLYALFLGSFNKSYKLSFYSIISLLIGATCSIYTVISFPLYSSYTFKLPAISTLPDEAFYHFNHLFYSPWRFGFLFQGPNGELALIIGYTQLFVMLCALFLLFKKVGSSSQRLNLLLWVNLFFIFLFLMHPSSKILWEHFPSLWMFIPFGRLSLALALITSVTAGYIAFIFSNSKSRKKFIYFLVLLTIGSTMLNWGHRGVIPKVTDIHLRKDVWKSTLNEGTTAYFLNNKWADFDNFWFSDLPNKHLEIMEGTAEVKEFARTSIRHQYVINAKSPIIVKENTLYFPGWSLTSNDRAVDIYPGNRGVIYAKLPQGLQYVELTYEDIPVYKFTKVYAVVVFSMLLILLVIQTIPLRIKRKK